MVAVVTSQKADRVYAHEALIEPPDGGLTTRSKVMLMQIRSVDRRRITGHYGNLSDAAMERVEEALRIATGLERL